MIPEGLDAADIYLFAKEILTNEDPWAKVASLMLESMLDKKEIPVDEENFVNEPEVLPPLPRIKRKRAKMEPTPVMEKVALVVSNFTKMPDQSISTPDIFKLLPSYTETALRPNITLLLKALTQRYPASFRLSGKRPFEITKLRKDEMDVEDILEALI